MAQIFICYRREDVDWVAPTLKLNLESHFGPNSVFLDVHNIPMGVDYREYIKEAVGGADVLLAVIGPEWLGEKAEDGSREIHQPSDFVRTEIESAIQQKIALIPVLVNDTKMPAEKDLPSSISQIAFRQAAELRSKELYDDTSRLIKALDDLLKRSKVTKKTTSTKKRAAGDIQTSVNRNRPRIPQPEHAFETSPEKVNKAAPKSRGQSKTKEAKAAQKAPLPKPPQPVPGQALLLLSRGTRKYQEQLMLVRRVLGGFTDSHLHVAPDIPVLKAQFAIDAYAPELVPGNVILLYDNTVFGAADKGLLLTSEEMYWRNSLSDKGSINYRDMKRVSHVGSDSMFAVAEVLIDGMSVKVTAADDRTKLASALATVISTLISEGEKRT